MSQAKCFSKIEEFKVSSMHIHYRLCFAYVLMLIFAFSRTNRKNVFHKAPSGTDAQITWLFCSFVYAAITH